MIGSHNSFTYLTPTKWWGKMLAPWAKCQSLNIKEQYKSGVRYFDARVAFDKSYNLRLVHNYVDFPLTGLYEGLEELNKHEDVWLRIILDMRKKPKDEAKETRLQCAFTDFITGIRKQYPNIKICEIIIGWDWRSLFAANIAVAEWHASVCAEWYEYILGTEYWAETHNHTMIRGYKDIMADDKKVLLIDYVQYG